MSLSAVQQTRFTSPLVGEVGARSAPGGGYASRFQSYLVPPFPTLPHKGGGDMLCVLHCPGKRRSH
jgi:hypothetical protein